MLTADEALVDFLRKYGQLVAYTVAVITLTIFLVDSNRAIKDVGNEVASLTSKVDAIQVVVRDREKYERWLKQANARLKRLYNARGWEYEDIE